MQKNLCPGCLREFEGTVCPQCGYPESGHNAAHQLPIGTVLRGRYQVGRALGQGGFGITYLAWDKLMLQPVAIKEFFPTGTVFRKSATSLTLECGTEEIIPHYEYTKQRFLREAGALVKFKDIPVIVDILDFAEENNTSYIIMEYVRGVDLAKYIRMKGGRLTVQETFRILKPVMEALAKVHKGGIVHRDISPDNIILDPMGGAKLLDFGAVRAVEDPDVNKGLNKSTEAILKHGFAPLEQYNSKGSLGPWTDEYAMCATVWYCLTGNVPVEASIRMMEGIDPDWSTIPGLPEHQQRALAKGLSRRAKDRYESIDHLLADLFPEDGRDISSMYTTGGNASLFNMDEIDANRFNSNTGKEPPKKKRFNPIWAVAAAAVLVVALVVALLIPKGGKTKVDDVIIGDNSSMSTDRSSNDDKPAPPPVTDPNAPESEETEPEEAETEETEPSTEPLSPEEEAYLHAEALLEEGKLGEAAIAFGKLSGYSDALDRSFAIWDRIAFRDTLSAEYQHTVGLRKDGTVIATGSNKDGKCDVDGWTNITAVFAGWYHTVGLRENHTVVATGLNDNGQLGVSRWSDIVAITAGGWHTVGLRADGTVVAVGLNEQGQCDVEDWTDIVAISAEMHQTIGLKADGTVVATGYNAEGQCNVSGWTDIVAISAGGWHTVGLRSDGTCVAVGYRDAGRCDVDGWYDIVAISAGGWHTTALRADGTVVAVGENIYGQRNVDSLKGVVAISAAQVHTVGLWSDGTVTATGFGGQRQCDVWNWRNIRQPYARESFR